MLFTSRRESHRHRFLLWDLTALYSEAIFKINTMDKNDEQDPESSHKADPLATQDTHLWVYRVGFELIMISQALGRTDMLVARL